jgi:predicted Zn finger-like uncharacterized protein
MIVICEECAKKYRINPEKIKGEKAKFKCKACNHLITVSKPEVNFPDSVREAAEQSGEFVPTKREVFAQDAGEKAPKSAEPGKDEKPAKPVKPAAHSLSLMGFGLRTKMTALFFVIPILLMITAGVLYLRDLNNLSELITGESAKMVTQFAEESIAEKARSVASQVQLYLESHKNSKKEEFNVDPGLVKVAVQKVGITGYTALYEMPDKDGIWRTWAHPNSKIIGIDMGTLEKPLGRNFPGFWKVYTGVQSGKESLGYYTWQDKDGTFRDKFMVCTPVEGTRFVIAATTYLDEFGSHVRNLESRANLLTVKMRNINFGILGGTLLLVGLIVAIYGHKLTGRIKALTLVAERISVGDLDAEVNIKSKDEIGALAEAISRMQESIRLSIERLRRRR